VVQSILLIGLIDRPSGRFVNNLQALRAHRPAGVTLAEIMETTGWQASELDFLAGEGLFFIGPDITWRGTAARRDDRCGGCAL